MGGYRSDDGGPTLPVYTAKRSVDYPSWLIVTCPREDCGESFIVRMSTWYRKKVYEDRVKGGTFTITGRACPYCFKASRLPSRSRIR